MHVAQLGRTPMSSLRSGLRSPAPRLQRDSLFTVVQRGDRDVASYNVNDSLRRTVAMVLAGGQGERLSPLTRDRAKPAVPFGGMYRIIDFTLSNCINSGLRRIHVLTQYKSYSLDRHIKHTWNILQRDMGEYVDVIPPQQRTVERWYHWPIRTHQHQSPPAKTVFRSAERQGELLDSLVSNGCIISGARVEHSILGLRVFVHSWPHVEDSVVFDDVQIGRHAKIRRAIIDKGVHIPDGEMIGYDLQMDRRRFTVSDGGIVAIAKGQVIEQQ